MANVTEGVWDRATLRRVGSHPLHLAFRFALELSAFVALGAFALTHFRGAWRLLMGLGLPLLAMVLWGVFAVPHDPSRIGSPKVPVPGALRLCLEFAVFGAGIWALLASGRDVLAATLGVSTALHYALSWDRVGWLLRPRGRTER